MVDLTSRVVAITGASAGIGEAIARQLGARGACVALAARRVDRLTQVADGIRQAGGHAIVVEADVVSEADMNRLADEAMRAFGRLDVMICNAGIGYHGRFEETSVEAMRRVLDVNVLGTFYAAHAALRVMKLQGHGHIIAVSSVVGRRGIGGSSIYAASKAAQVTFIESLRAEFLGTAFHASVVFPVATTTEFHHAIERDFGHAISGRGPRQAADTVAASVVRCIESPQAEVYPHSGAWWLAVLNLLAPKQTDKVVQRFGRSRT